MKLSILICSLPSIFRPVEKANSLFNTLTRQSAGKSVQILYLGDNKSMTVGEKRNKLMSIADGDFITFVDDDDQVTDDYIDTLLKYTDLNIDLVTIGVIYTQNGKNEKIYDYGLHKDINFREQRNHSTTGVPLKPKGTNMAGRIPNHLCLWRKTTATRVKFPATNIAEDRHWADQQRILGYQVAHKYDKIIYHYNFDTFHTQTRRPPL